MKQPEISKDLFDHLVDLAALQLNQQESKYIFIQLNHQLSAIQELKAIDIDPDVPIALHGVPYPVKRSPALRSDKVESCEDSSAILSEAPQLEDGYIVVPDIPHTTLE